MYLVNGLPSDVIPVTDRGFQYADGLFETIAIKDGEPLLFDRHLARLALGCAKLGIAMPARELLASEARRLCEGVERQVLKIVVTRGSGGRGYRPEGAGPTTRVLAALPWPEHPSAWRDSGVAVRLCRTRLGGNPDLTGLKHLARLEQVLARGEWNDASVQEGLMLDTEGHVIEGTMSNVFLVQGGRLVTPSLEACGVRGVMRDALLDCATRSGVDWEERVITVEELHGADGLFLTNSLIGLWPVRRFEGTEYTVPPVVRELAAQLIRERACA
ncbi:MAG: aminodeoxychorismate lyase [Thiohalomonadaceae bacterium]